jgi:competence protein ComEA
MTDTRQSSTRPGGDPEFWERRFHDERRRTRRGGPPGARELPPRPTYGTRRRDGLVTRLRDLADRWRGDARIGISVLLLVALAAGVTWYLIGAGRGPSAPPARTHVASHTTRAAPTTSASASAAPTSGAEETTGTAAAGAKAGDHAAKVVVHVAGAVAHPGVVELAPNTRVIDAVEAVGGALPDADLDRLNLAARISDGERVFVAKVGQADPGVEGDAAAGTAGGGTTGGKVDLNTATEAQLEALPGIGPTFAQAIIAERQRRGGFRSVGDLRTVRGIGDKRFAELQPLVTV